MKMLLMASRPTVTQIFTGLLPLGVGKAMRELIPGAKRWFKSHKRNMGLVSSLNVVMIVWQVISQARDHVISSSVTQMTSVIGACVLVHFT